MKSQYSISIVFLVLLLVSLSQQQIPLAISTWNLPIATERAWEVVSSPDGTALDALVEGCTLCERMQCNLAVGFGGNPDEMGETTLDAMIFDGETMNTGAVGALREVKDAIAVARFVMENTKHSLIVGSQATEFALQMGFPKESLQTNYSKNMWETWKGNSCQPNFRINVTPNPSSSCGPYNPLLSKYRSARRSQASQDIDLENHDTIGMIVIDRNQNVVAGTTTNGLRYKIPGRVGDSPVVGSGAYADNLVGGAVSTGDGDVLMRFVPAFLAVEELRRGATPTEAAWTAVKRIAAYYPEFSGAVLVANRDGEYGAACNGRLTFPFTVQNPETGDVILEEISC